ncbi:MAG: hypothetical protein ACFFD2_01755 [Promethearchaeota archaeon]
MFKVDIIGEFNEDLDESIEENFELYLIDRITHAEDFQEILFVYPLPKKKLRWKGYSEEDAAVLYEYVDNGGILVLIPPFNSQKLEKTLEIYDIFQISPIFCMENLLLHVNPHIINYGKEGKLPIKKYFHFLTQEREPMEVIIEGNWIPIFAFKFIGKGVVILYGLGTTNFWKEDLLSIFKYLKQDFTYFWDKSTLSEKQLENVLRTTRKKNHNKIRDEFIRIFVQKKSFNEFLEIKNPSLREELLQNIKTTTIQDEYKDLSGKFIAKKYREHYKLLNKEYPVLIKQIQKFIYTKVVDKTLNEKTFKRLYESDLLPPEAAHLLIFYLETNDPENYKKFKENLSNLIQWNKKEQLFEEDFLKELAWDHL